MILSCRKRKEVSLKYIKMRNKIATDKNQTTFN